jgi:hypothetical protein
MEVSRLETGGMEGAVYLNLKKGQFKPQVRFSGQG